MTDPATAERVLAQLTAKYPAWLNTGTHNDVVEYRRILAKAFKLKAAEKHDQRWTGEVSALLRAVRQLQALVTAKAA